MFIVTFVTGKRVLTSGVLGTPSSVSVRSSAGAGAAIGAEVDDTGTGSV